MGLLPWTAKVTADRMSFNGRDLLKMPPADRRRIIGKDIAMIFQHATGQEQGFLIAIAVVGHHLQWLIVAQTAL
jgi:ABC-type antimicrobial peptide transport system ATPase subunit